MTIKSCDSSIFAAVATIATITTIPEQSALHRPLGCITLTTQSGALPDCAMPRRPRGAIYGGQWPPAPSSI
jgi:hypothetical protein